MSGRLDLSHYAMPQGDGTLGLELAVEGVACGNCIAKIENAVKRLPGVTEARLNFTNRRLRVAWAEGAPVPAQLLPALEAVDPFEPQGLQAAIDTLAASLGRTLGEVAPPIRVALTGTLLHENLLLRRRRDQDDDRTADERRGSEGRLPAAGKN